MFVVPFPLPVSRPPSSSPLSNGWVSVGAALWAGGVVYLGVKSPHASTLGLCGGCSCGSGSLTPNLPIAAELIT